MVSEEHKEELRLEAMAEAREEAYYEWKCNNLKDLKTDFVERQKLEKLQEYILEEIEDSFHDWLIDEFEEFCKERFGDDQ